MTYLQTDWFFGTEVEESTSTAHLSLQTLCHEAESSAAHLPGEGRRMQSCSLNQVVNELGHWPSHVNP